MGTSRVWVRWAAFGAAAGFALGSGVVWIAVAFDGTNIWVTNSASGTVSKIDPKSAAPGLPIDFTVGAAPRGIAFDGSSLWVTNSGAGTVSKIDPKSAAPGTPVGYVAGLAPEGVAFDGSNVWVTNFSAGTITQYVP